MGEVESTEMVKFSSIRIAVQKVGLPPDRDAHRLNSPGRRYIFLQRELPGVFLNAFPLLGSRIARCWMSIAIEGSYVVW